MHLIEGVNESTKYLSLQPETTRSYKLGPPRYAAAVLTTTTSSRAHVNARSFCQASNPKSLALAVRVLQNVSEYLNVSRTQDVDYSHHLYHYYLVVEQ